jgi:hypothetical protein
MPARTASGSNSQCSATSAKSGDARARSAKQDAKTPGALSKGVGGCATKIPPANLGLVRRVAASLLKQDMEKGSIKAKPLRAGCASVRRPCRLGALHLAHLGEVLWSPNVVPVRPRCAARADCGGRAKQKRLVRWAQVTTGRIPAALLGGQSLQPLLRGGNISRWNCSRGPRGGPSGKDRVRGARRRPGSEKCPNILRYQRLTEGYHERSDAANGFSPFISGYDGCPVFSLR